MIDYLALSIGHGLIAIALLRLVMRDGLDVDPFLQAFKPKASGRRKARGKTRQPSHRDASDLPKDLEAGEETQR